MSKTIFGLAAAILISLPGVAGAQVYPVIPAPAAPGATPQRLSPRQAFHWLDTNHDGFLSLQEFLAAPWVTDTAQATRFFYWMDTNHDGFVSLPEFLAAYARYSGNGGYYLQVAYPWAWTCWRPANYGWYWQSGWHRRPGAWPAYAASPRPAVRQVAPANHPHPAKQVKPPKAKHQGKQNGHGHSHAKHHR
jgi:hypothetical protein